MITIREATPADRDEVLSFCSNTFSWGDYINQVWDLWLNDERGKMLVAESDGRQVGLSHVALCKGSNSIWLEGVRVHPSFRRAGIATDLMDNMLGYGIRQGAPHALAIVAADNKASQRMMERSGFSVVSEWAYYSTGDELQSKPSNARIASAEDLDAIVRYLESSRIYQQAAKKYVDSWHWYALNRLVLEGFVTEGRVVLSGQPMAGIAVINRNGYWNRKNILQVVYLDSQNLRALQDLIAYVTNCYIDGGYERLHILCARERQMISVIERFHIEESEQFLLYSKVFSG